MKYIVLLHIAKLNVKVQYGFIESAPSSIINDLYVCLRYRLDCHFNMEHSKDINLEQGSITSSRLTIANNITR
jgi:hypothetical protein